MSCNLFLRISFFNLLLHFSLNLLSIFLLVSYLAFHKHKLIFHTHNLSIENGTVAREGTKALPDTRKGPFNASAP